jgi:hypothetical protein
MNRKRSLTDVWMPITKVPPQNPRGKKSKKESVGDHFSDPHLMNRNHRPHGWILRKVSLGGVPPRQDDVLTFPSKDLDEVSMSFGLAMTAYCEYLLALSSSITIQFLPFGKNWMVHCKKD